MSYDETSKNTDLIIWIIRIYFLLAAIQGFLVIYLLLRIPVESGISAFFGFSIRRLAIAMPVAFASIGFIWVALKSIQDKRCVLNFTTRLEGWLNRKNNFNIIILLLIILTIGWSYFILLGYDVIEPFSRAYFVRLQPIAFWFVGLSIQSLIALAFINFGLNLNQIKPPNKIFRIATLLFGFFILLWLWIAWTRIGLEAESVGWNSLGSPILETQVLFAWIFAVALIFLSPSIQHVLERIPWPKKSTDPFTKFDILVSIFLWIVTIVVWNSIPLTSSWFISPPRAPNFEFYPNSDAILYDTTAQSALVGEGFKSWGTAYASRPMYAQFLGILHIIGGLEYEPIIFIQVAVFAIFPVLLYWIGRNLYNRLSGIIVAILITAREANAILLNNVITVSHSKLIMADFPTAIGVALFCVCMLAWLKNLKPQIYFPLVAGGILGIFMLIRPEVGIQLFVAGLVILIIFFRQPVRWLKSNLFLAIGLLLVLSPWIWRNWQIDHKIFIDQPNYRADLFAKRYSEDPEETSIKVEPGETYEEYNERMAEKALEFAQDQPDSIARFVISHYINSQIQTVLILPTSFRLIDSGIELLGHKSLLQFWEDCCSINGFIRRLPFWFKWDGILPHQSIIPIIINLFMIALGVSVSWHRNRTIGLLPAAFMVAHLLINAFVRNSGGRYILPVDWVSILYFSIGIAYFTIWGFKHFSTKEPSGLLIAETNRDTEDLKDERTSKNNSSQLITILLIAAALLLIGFSLPITEKMISPRYISELSPTQVMALIEQEGDTFDSDIQDSLESILTDNATIIQGRALYPRYYFANVGEPGEWRSFQPRPYRRVSFYLVGPQNIGIILPDNDIPDHFPHGSDVIVIGCYNDRYFDALGIIILNSTDQSVDEVLLRSSLDDVTCPLMNLD